MYLLPLLPRHICQAAHVWPLAAFRRCCELLYAAIVECRRAGVTITTGQHVADAGHMQTCIAADRSTTSAIAQAACAGHHLPPVAQRAAAQSLHSYRSWAVSGDHTRLAGVGSLGSGRGHQSRLKHRCVGVRVARVSPTMIMSVGRLGYVRM